jgi:hypothetical protein
MIDHRVLSTRFCMYAFALHLGLYMVLCLRLPAEHKRRILQGFERHQITV